MLNAESYFKSGFHLSSPERDLERIVIGRISGCRLLFEGGFFLSFMDDELSKALDAFFSVPRITRKKSGEYSEDTPVWVEYDGLWEESDRQFAKRLLKTRKKMQDEQLQLKANDAAKKYLDAMFPNLNDLERRAWIFNAVANGYLKGYNDRDGEEG